MMDCFDPEFVLPSAPPAPAPCRVCNVEMSPERAGRYDRCEPCWADLLAAQPTETETR